MTQILEAEGESPGLELKASVEGALNDPNARAEAKRRASDILSTIRDDLEKADWWDNEWVHRTVDTVAIAFDQACARWRSLYKAAQRQFDGITLSVEVKTKIHILEVVDVLGNRAVEGREYLEQNEKYVEDHGVGHDFAQGLDGFFTWIKLGEGSHHQTKQNQESRPRGKSRCQKARGQDSGHPEGPGG